MAYSYVQTDQPTFCLYGDISFVIYWLVLFVLIYGFVPICLFYY